MKITATDEDEKNFHLIQLNIKSNLRIEDDGELSLSDNHVKSDGICSNQVLVITDNNAGIRKGDWFTLHGEIHRLESELEIKRLSREHEVTRKIIASNSPLITPYELIPRDDLKYIVEYWNKHKQLPDGELEENHFVKGQPRTLGTNEVFIDWEKEIEAMNNVAEVSDETPRSQAFNSIREALSEYPSIKKGRLQEIRDTQYSNPSFAQQEINKKGGESIKQIEGEAHEHSNSRGLIEPHEAYCSFIEGAKSESAKQYHQKGMYDEDEVLQLLLRATTENYDNLYDWFQKLKK